ncbi:hypothetical protein [Lysobacter sp. A3-1-A15]|uniref:hypothetical protein n=1 Tax=Novilysobacter viscosus TaxID=3098602 RepID=UPI002ED91B1C
MSSPQRPLAGFLSALLLLPCGFSLAAEPPQWWANVNLASQHFGDEDEFLPQGESFNQFNPGLGVEAQWQPRHAVAVGFYRNSIDDNSLYALYRYTPLQLGRHVRIGGMIGAVTGYPGYNEGGVAPAAGLVAKIEGERLGANVILLPRIADKIPATLGLQFKWRLR